MPLLDPNRAPITSNVGVRSNREDHTHPSLASSEPCEMDSSFFTSVAARVIGRLISLRQRPLRHTLGAVAESRVCHDRAVQYFWTCSLASLAHTSTSRDYHHLLTCALERKECMLCSLPLQDRYTNCSGISTARASDGGMLVV